MCRTPSLGVAMTLFGVVPFAAPNRQEARSLPSEGYSPGKRDDAGERGKGGTGCQKITKRSRGWGILMIFVSA